MSEAKNEVPHVFKAIAEVTAKLGHEGIKKGRENTQQNYKFRGIDDVYNALSSALSDAKLCILPRVTERAVVERATRNGGALFYVTVKVDYDFVSAVDGSRHVVTTYGEAMDSGDKATNKAMSAAYKYAAMQAFCIPTEGDNDADATTHEVASVPTGKAAKGAATSEPPHGATAASAGAAAQRGAKAASPSEPSNLTALKAACKAAGLTGLKAAMHFCSNVCDANFASFSDLNTEQIAMCTVAANKAKVSDGDPAAAAKLADEQARGAA